MKHLLTILCVLTSFTALAQFPNTHTQSNPYTKEVFNGSVNPKKGLINARYPDTATANLDYIASEPGGQIIVGNTIYVRNTTATGWIISANSSVTPSNVTIYNDSTLIICNNNGCDSFKTNIVINNFNIVNDSTIIVCDGNNTCDTLHINPTPFAKSYVDSTKIIDGISYYYIDGNRYSAGATTTQHTLIGGYVSWKSGLTFEVTPATWWIGDTQYSSDGGEITLDAADADFGRIDLIGFDTTGSVIKITGEASAVPLVPQIDPFSQTALTTGLLLNPSDTVPYNVSRDIIYDENNAPPEWVVTSNGGITIDKDNIDMPYSGTKDILVSSYNDIGRLIFTGDKKTASLDKVLKFRIKLTDTLISTNSFRLSLYNGASLVTTTYFKNGYGFRQDNITDYQNVTIPFSIFSSFTGTTFNRIYLYFLGSSTDAIYVDKVELQSGIANLPPQGDYSNKLDSVYARNDSLFQYAKGVETFRGLFTGSSSGSGISKLGDSPYGLITVNDSTYKADSTLLLTKLMAAASYLTPSNADLTYLKISDTTDKWIPKGTYFPIGVYKPIIAIDSFNIGLDSFNLKELRYSLAQRDTTNWTDTTLIDKGYLNDRIATFVAGSYHLPYNGTSTDYLGGDTVYHALPTIPAQFNPIAGTGIILSGTYPDITFNSTGSSSVWSKIGTAAYYKAGNVIVGDSIDNGHGFQVDVSTSFNLGSDAPGDIFYRDSLGTFTRLAAPTGFIKPVLGFKNGYPKWQEDSIGTSTTLSTLTDAGTITWDYLIQGTEAKVTLGGNRTLSITNLPSSVVYFTLTVIQDATGGRTLTLPASTKVINSGAGAVTLSTGAGAVDILSFRWTGSTLYCTYGKSYN